MSVCACACVCALCVCVCVYKNKKLFFLLPLNIDAVLLNDFYSFLFNVLFCLVVLLFVSEWIEEHSSAGATIGPYVAQSSGDIQRPSELSVGPSGPGTRRETSLTLTL